MQARVKQDYRMGSVMAFSGHEYCREEWRPVPEGMEAQARKHPLLDVRETPRPEDLPAVEAEEAKAERRGRPRNKPNEA